MQPRADSGRKRGRSAPTSTSILSTLLGVLVGGNGRLTDQEAELFNDLFAEVLGGRQTLPVLRALLKERALKSGELTAHAPAFFEAIVRMDVASGTRVATEALLALQKIGREAAALDGDIGRAELTALTDYILMLRKAAQPSEAASLATTAEAPEGNARDTSGEAPSAGRPGGSQGACRNADQHDPGSTASPEARSARAPDLTPHGVHGQSRYRKNHGGASHVRHFPRTGRRR